MSDSVPKDRRDRHTLPKVQRDRELANDLLEQADLQALHALYQNKCDEIESIAKGLPALLDAVDAKPRMDDVHVSEVCNSMRDVALAAIQLARDVSTLARE